MSTCACVLWCSRPPNSEHDITDTLIESRTYFELPPRLSNLTHNGHRQERKPYKCRNNFITSIAIFHASSVGLRYSPVFTCFSFFFSIELVTKRNRYICVSICLMFQMIDIASLLMPISMPGLSLDLPLLFISFLHWLVKILFQGSLDFWKLIRRLALMKLVRIS